MMSMNDVNVPALKDRVTKIFTDPANEWRRIEPEPTTIQQLYTGFIIPVAAIPVVASFIGSVIIGTPFIGRTGPVAGIVIAVFTLAMMLIGTYVSAFIISKLAPTFSSVSDDRQALKLVAYSSAPVWVAGILNIIPFLGMLAILAWIFTIYVFYLGVPIMMKTPQDKVIPYMLVSALVMIVVSFTLAMIGVAVATTMFVTSAVFS
jgi:hypothetical protein